ncbi:ceramide kinase [Discoglossus pictus]
METTQASPPGPPPPAGLCSVLSVKNKSYEVTLDQTLLEWREVRARRGRPRGGAASGQGSCLGRMLHGTRGLAGRFTGTLNSGCHTVPVSEIVSVGEAEIDEKYYHGMKFQHMCKPHAFTVHYVQRAKKHRWRCKAVTFWCSDDVLCCYWLQALNDLLEQQTCRPKNLLVYINPYGGKKKGKQIYERKVAPLFSLAAISTDVIVTEYANHARDDLYEVSLEKYDGIVCVGGDGMFSEVLHGLIGRVQKDSEVDQHNPKALLTKCNLRIGIIPAGSTDCVCFSSVGINDPVTSALHIILDGVTFCNIVNTTHPCLSLLFLIKVELQFSNFLVIAVCAQFLPVIFFFKLFILLLDQEEDWTTIKGKFMAINAANMSCACPRSPKGISPAAHLADGTADLILVRKCSRLNFLRHLIRHTTNKDQFDFGFVDVYRVKTFQFTPKHCDDEDSESTEMGNPGKKNFPQICTDHPSCGCCQVNSIWNCDGEVLDQAPIEMRVHCQLIQLFARGIDDTQPEDMALSRIL